MSLAPAFRAGAVSSSFKHKTASLRLQPQLGLGLDRMQAQTWKQNVFKPLCKPCYGAEKPSPPPIPSPPFGEPPSAVRMGGGGNVWGKPPLSLPPVDLPAAGVCTAGAPAGPCRFKAASPMCCLVVLETVTQAGRQWRLWENLAWERKGGQGGRSGVGWWPLAPTSRGR